MTGISDLDLKFERLDRAIEAFENRIAKDRLRRTVQQNVDEINRSFRRIGRVGTVVINDVRRRHSHGDGR